jgi:uncharacterized protein (DUF1778 family)
MKQGRIELRASQKERERLLEAAAFTGMSLSAFLRQAALEKSNNVLKNRDTITLSDRDRDLFLDALENPPKPNKRLKQAFNMYQKRKSGMSKTSSGIKTKKSKVITHKE